MIVNHPLLAWLDNPTIDRGIHFARQGEDWEFWSYAQLAQFAKKFAWALVESGVQENDVIALVERSGPEFVATLFGTMLAGATPLPLAPPTAFRNLAVYEEHITGVLVTVCPSLIVTHTDFVDRIGELAASVGIRKTLAVDKVLSGATEGRIFPDRELATFALLQFTSGSSSLSRGVRVPFEALEVNVEAIRRWVQWNENDSFASWLPIYHDMGLIGGIISPIVNRSDLWLLQPEQFIRRPLRYLRCFGMFGATLTTTPNFGLDFIVRRMQPSALEGLDFSKWRVVIVGAERIDPRTLNRFCELLSPSGFRRQALLPAYGLAEATLAVTGLPLEEEWTSVAVEPSSLLLGCEIVTCHEGNNGQDVVGCGWPLEDVSIAIVNDDGRLLPHRHVGEIVVQGPSVTAGYCTEIDSPSLTHFSVGGLYTGDAGFIVDGQLFVLGRLGDSLKIRGRMIFSEDLEIELSNTGVPRYRVAVLIGLHGGVVTVVAVFDQPDQAWLAEAGVLLRRLTEGAQVVLVDAPRGTIPRTSSSKPKRRQLWQVYVQGALPGTVVMAGPDEVIHGGQNG